uniref:uncharacterized protein n=1 Tax=Centroberyx gerrardi TaxID=166262 RepID=UPI003AADE819
MQSRYLLYVLLALSSLILSNTQDVIVSGHFCHRAGPAGEGQTRLMFLREETAGTRSLYLTLWSKDMRLVRCEVNTDPLVTESYRSLCSRSGTEGQEISQRFNISMLLAPGAACAPDSTAAPQFTKRTKRDGSEGKVRRKRAWIFPGTLWCGTGSRATGYEQLGMFESADRCCREHDHCVHIIPAFTVDYGVFNPNFFTVSHCDCDQRFQQCLLGVNDTISNMVGYSFFNILRVPCFELIQQRRCTEMYWWGMCKVAKEAPYAIFQNPLSYNTTRVTSKYGDTRDSNESTSIEGHHVMERPPTNPNRKSPKGEHRCTSRDPPRGDTFHRKKKKGKGCNRSRKTSTTLSTQMPPVSMAHSTNPSTLTTAALIQKMTNASKTNTSISNKKKRGKKKGLGKQLTAYPTHKSQVPSQVTTKSYPKTASTTQSTPTVTQRAALHLPTTITPATTVTTKTHKKVQKKSRRCGPRMPVRGDTFQPRRKTCLEKNPSLTTTIIPSTSTAVLPSQGTAAQTQRPSKTSASPKGKTATRLWNTAPSTTPIKVKLETGLPPQTAVPLHQDDNQLLCGSLKHLDECKYKIPPLEKKYELQNMESKTVYHCGCTSRLAGQIEHSKIPTVLRSLLMDFVSHYCFKLPKEKKCRNRKSCAAGFSKASDLLQALKKIEEKDTAGVQKSRKRGIPVHLYKRCLRIVEPGKRG